MCPPAAPLHASRSARRDAGGDASVGPWLCQQLSGQAVSLERDRETRAPPGRSQGLGRAMRKAWRPQGCPHRTGAALFARGTQKKKKDRLRLQKSLKPEWKWLRGVRRCQADWGAISICFLTCSEPCLSFVLTAPGGRRYFPASLPCCCLMDRCVGDALADPCFLRREEELTGCPET